jgi:hypothetical protein
MWTYASKVLVEQLDVSVDDLEDDELVVALLDGAAKIQTRVPKEFELF